MINFSTFLSLFSGFPVFAQVDRIELQVVGDGLAVTLLVAALDVLQQVLVGHQFAAFGKLLFDGLEEVLEVPSRNPSPDGLRPGTPRSCRCP